MALSLLCVGEVLWDVFEGNEHLGGAPLNVAVTASRLGLQSGVFSAVGDDERGRRALGLVREYGVRPFVRVDPERPTGEAVVSLSEDKVPSFSLPSGVAYDALSLSSEVEGVAAEASFVYVGSLAQRAAESREAVRGALRASAGRVVFDVNRRKGVDDWAGIVRETLPFTTILKTNEEEFAAIAEELGVPVERVSSYLFERFPLELVCVTKGGKGVRAFTPSASFSVPVGDRGRVVDTTGCGDAFCAGLVSGLHKGLPVRDAVSRGVVVAGVVAGFEGAIPPEDEFVETLRERSILI